MRIEAVYQLVPREQLPCVGTKRQRCAAPCRLQHGGLPDDVRSANYARLLEAAPALGVPEAVEVQEAVAVW